MAAILNFPTKKWTGKMETVFSQFFRVNINEKSQLFKIYMKKSQNMYLLHNSVYYVLLVTFCLPVFENIYILIIVLLCLFYLCIYFYIFLNSFLVFFLRTTLETSVLLCALMCLSSVNIIFICIIMFYQINSLTHTHRH